MSVRCWLRADREDGNDPVEAMVVLAHRPVKGELIEVWNSEGGYRNSPVSSDPEAVARGYSWSGEPLLLEVRDVVHQAYGDESDDFLEVWVSMDTYDIAQLERAMEAASRREGP